MHIICKRIFHHFGEHFIASSMHYIILIEILFFVRLVMAFSRKKMSNLFRHKLFLSTKFSFWYSFLLIEFTHTRCCQKKMLRLWTCARTWWREENVLPSWSSLILVKGMKLFLSHKHRVPAVLVCVVLSLIESSNISFFRFTVEADKFIKDLTIITEYTGDVDYLRSRENDEGDSIMTLISASNPSQSLVICPDNKANIARFINGINNHTP